MLKVSIPFDKKYYLPPDRADQRILIDDLLKRIDGVEACMIRLNYGLDGEPVTMKEIGQHIGRSSTRIGQRISKAFAMLRQRQRLIEAASDPKRRPKKWKAVEASRAEFNPVCVSQQSKPEQPRIISTVKEFEEYWFKSIGLKPTPRLYTAFLMKPEVASQYY